MERLVVGIDLGTSHTVVASASAADRTPRVFSVPQRVARTEVEARSLFPSCAFAVTAGEIEGVPLAGEEGGWVLGAYAKARGIDAPSRFVASSKSWLCHPHVDKTAPILPWEAESEEGPNGPKLSPVDVATRILSRVREAWDAEHPKAPLANQDVILTVPASFDEVARELTLEAATRARIQVRLLEEPQAAFYAAMDRGALDEVHGSTLALVVDVGGGTTDLSLLSVDGEADARRVRRIAVGTHLLLGGDNMDLALAHALEPRLVAQPDRLDPRRFAELVIACRSAKERMLGASPPEELTVSILGRGSQLLGGSLRTKLLRGEVESLALEGFLPIVDRDARPSRARGGLVAFGLPFERDPAITKHIAAFVARHAPAREESPSIGAVLLNGGVFRAERAAQRVLDTVSSWQPTPPVLLAHPDPDLAVALGAVVYGLALRGIGRRIEGGSARAYFVGIGRDAEGAGQAVCVLPKGAEEGSITRAKGRSFSLVVGRPARFELYSSDDAVVAAAGDLVAIDPERFDALPPLATALGDDGEGAKSSSELKVEVEAELTAIGTLEIACVERAPATPPGRRFRLAFDLRGSQTGDAPPLSNRPSTRPGRTAKALDEATHEIERVFGRKDASEARDAKGLLRELERVLGERSRWTTEEARALADALLATAKGRRRTADHERSFFLLAGYCLRPGFGHPGDASRVGKLVPLFAERLAFPKEARGWQQFFIAYRRVAGGLLESAQTKIRDELDPFVAPAEANLKKPKGLRPESTDDLLDLLSHLERLPPQRRAALGAWLLERTWTDRDPRIWAALGRIGARIPVYASLHQVVSPVTAERWIDHLLREKWNDLPTAPRAASELARRTDDRARDVSESVRVEVARRLAKESADPRFARVVSELVPLEETDRTAFFGETLPVGLTLES